MRKFILDIDTGIDDALAITYLLSQKNIEVIGLTTTFGNVVVDDAFKNTVNLLHVLGRDDVPVYRGASHPLAEDHYEMREISKRVHGENGVGNVILPDANRKAPEMSAKDFIKESCHKYGKELTLITVGPMTNASLVWQEDPEALKSIDRIVCMGGALVVPGNCSPFAEANFRGDPDAAKMMLESGLPITMVGLDVTLQAVITEEDIVTWLDCDNEAARALYQMSQYYYTNESSEDQKISGVLHDPLAVEVAIYPEIIEQYYNCDLTVDTAGVQIGRSTGNKLLINSGTRNTKVCLRYDGPSFVKRFSESVLHLLQNIK